MEGGAGNVDVVVLNADSVDTQLVWHKVHCKQTVFQLGNGGLVNLV